MLLVGIAVGYLLSGRARQARAPFPTPPQPAARASPPPKTATPTELDQANDLQSDPVKSPRRRPPPSSLQPAPAPRPNLPSASTKSSNAAEPATRPELQDQAALERRRRMLEDAVLAARGKAPADQQAQLERLYDEIDRVTLSKDALDRLETRLSAISGAH
jgi:hypothetical protein